jgi:hypothetical protein
MERRLATMFSTDVQGYSRLMGEDEAATAAEAVVLGVTGLERTFSGVIAAATTQPPQALARLLAARGSLWYRPW